jgi:hypothetical protein
MLIVSVNRTHSEAVQTRPAARVCVAVLTLLGLDCVCEMNDIVCLHVYRLVLNSLKPSGYYMYHQV